MRLDRPGKDAPNAESSASEIPRNFPHIEITRIFAPNVSSRSPATKQFSRPRNHFLLLRADIPKRRLTNNPPNEAPPSGELGACHVRTSSPSTPQPRRTSPLPSATSDEMLLAEHRQGRPHRDACALFPSQRPGLPLRAAHRARHHDGRRPRQPGVPGRVAHRQPVRGPLAGFDLAVVDRPLQGADRAAPAQASRTSTRKTCCEIADEADTPEASLDRANTSAILRACVAKLSPAHREIINLVYYHEKSVEEAGADHRHSPEHGEDPHVLCPQATWPTC